MQLGKKQLRTAATSALTFMTFLEALMGRVAEHVGHHAGFRLAIFGYESKALDSYIMSED
jgi:hypothetical protein